MKDEKPRSRVMPRSLDCGCLSKAAVEPVVESARASDVLPESTCPRTPTLILRVRAPPAFATSLVLRGFNGIAVACCCAMSVASRSKLLLAGGCVSFAIVGAAGRLVSGIDEAMGFVNGGAVQATWVEDEDPGRTNAVSALCAVSVACSVVLMEFTLLALTNLAFLAVAIAALISSSLFPGKRSRRVKKATFGCVISECYYGVRACP